jgi:hypothetical protein
MVVSAVVSMAVVSAFSSLWLAGNESLGVTWLDALDRLELVIGCLKPNNKLHPKTPNMLKESLLNDRFVFIPPKLQENKF